MTSAPELELDFSDHEELEFADRIELQAPAEETVIRQDYHPRPPSKPAMP